MKERRATNLKAALTLFAEHWSPRVVAELNGEYQLKPERVDVISRRRHPLCIDAGNVFGCGARLTYNSRAPRAPRRKRPLRRA